jgi:hypothetical protein
MPGVQVGARAQGRGAPERQADLEQDDGLPRARARPSGPARAGRAALQQAA